MTRAGEGLEQVGWVTYDGVPGRSEPGQAFLHGHLPDEWGGSGPEHDDCEPVYRIVSTDD